LAKHQEKDKADEQRAQRRVEHEESSLVQGDGLFNHGAKE
jgi:hypothetical protein